MPEIVSAEKNTDFNWESATDQVREVYGGETWTDAAWSGGAGSWSFDPETLNNVLSRWEKLRDDALGDREAIRRMLNHALPPSEDQVSVGFTNKIVEGLLSLQESNDSMLTYVESFIEKLAAAKRHYQSTEDANVEPFRDAELFGE